VKSKRFKFRRYRLKQQTADAIRKGHPWIFRDKVSSVLDSVADGQWLQLLDPKEKTVAFGIHQKEGGVAIRILRHGELEPSLGWLKKMLAKALKKREAMRLNNQAFRLLNGENDFFPGVVIDVYGNHGVLQTYHPSVDSLGRYAAAVARQMLNLQSVTWKMPQKRIATASEENRTGEKVRMLFGQRPGVVIVQEEQIQLAADLSAGQKSGTFLDLRGLRRYLASAPLKNKKVLNLFAYTGSAGLACCVAGASQVINVDAAQQSLDFGEKHHAHPNQQWVKADIFPWLKDLSARQKFDWIIVDPPAMATQKTQVPFALTTYQRIYRRAKELLNPGGTIVACCCTSRISPTQFKQCVGASLPSMKPVADLPMELDHHSKFPESNYLKVVVFR
jgi:23S rRNA (cytosine1962-C5)-methyltransferase